MKTNTNTEELIAHIACLYAGFNPNTYWKEALNNQNPKALEEARNLIDQYVQQRVTKAQLGIVSTANCTLQADEPAIDEIWFDFEGMPMRQDTLIGHLQASLNNTEGDNNASLHG